MEGIMGEVGESIKEAADKSSSNHSGTIKVNGDMNGSFEEAMEVEGAETKSEVSSDVAEDNDEPPSDFSDQAKENMDVDNDSSEVPSNLTVKSESGDLSPKREVLDVSAENSQDLSSDSINNGPCSDTHKDGVDEDDGGSECNSEQSDNRGGLSKVSVDNNLDKSHADDMGDKGEAKSEGENSASENKDHSDEPRTLQNGDVAEGSDCEDASSSIKQENNDGGQEEETTPEKEDGERGESEESAEGEDTTPTKKGKGRKNPVPLSLTPRRSSRNLNKQKSYAEDKEEVQEKDEGSDIEEIAMVDPLAGAGDALRENKENSKARNSRGSTNKTIVVNDTKHLVEIASGSKQIKGMKKEPTLVIIDTNSILSGRGAIPISQPNKLPQRSGLQITPAHMSSSSSSSSIPQSFSVLPVSSHNQAVFSGGVTSQRVSTPPAPAAPSKPPIILPSLTDDMYVVEAPSFIVPYVYEKPPIKPLKDFIENLEEIIKKTKEEEEKKKVEEAERKKDEEDKKKEEEDKMKEEEGKMKEEGKKKEEEGKKKDEEDKKKDDEIKEEVEKDEAEKSEEKGENEEGKTKEQTEVEKKADDESSESKETQLDEDSNKLKKKEPEEAKKDKDKDDTALRDQERDQKEKEETSSDAGKTEGKASEEPKKPLTYFDNPLGKFFMQIGVNLVQEHVQTDLLRSQKKKRDREGGKGGASTQMAINSLQQTLEFSKENNEPFHLKQKKCEYCSFKTESALVMAHHMETPHMRNYIYRCNFCPLEVRSPHDILFHMEAEHNVRGRLERGPAFHQCPNCPFEDNQKGKLTRHLVSCQKKYRPEKNQEPPLDWEPPAKIPKVSRNRPFPMGSPGVTGLTGPQKNVMGQQHPLLPKLPAGSTMVGQPTLGQVANSFGRGRGRPPVQGRFVPDLKQAQAIQQQHLQRPIAGMLYQTGRSGSQPQVLVPTSYQIAGNQIYQVVGGQVIGGGMAVLPRPGDPSATSPYALMSNIASGSSFQNSKGQANKLQQQPSISITPLPRQSSATPPHAHSTGMAVGNNKPGHPSSGGKATFVICEICDGYIKDLEQLRNHMQWIHKVKIHPKMIYNRPPLNCQKCQFRFFTDQGLERHLLGSHGLVTSSMQEAANKGKDGGRCPVCGRVYQWKLLNHVARDHSMTLKPAHLSYKCTVCTATFGMYKQFENHVYSAHSVVAKRVMEKKPGGSGSPTVSRSPGQSQQGDSLLKPLKINDEITIIPQPARTARPGPAGRSGPVPAHLQGGKVGEDRQRRSGTSAGALRDDDAVQIIDLDDSPSKDTLSAVQERLRRRTSLEVSQVESEDDVSSPPVKKIRRD